MVLAHWSLWRKQTNKEMKPALPTLHHLQVIIGYYGLTEHAVAVKRLEFCNTVKNSSALIHTFERGNLAC